MPVNSKFCTYDPVQKIWSGRKHTPIYNTDANLGYLILQNLIQSPQSVFQISDNSSIELTNFDIYNRSIKFANFLTKSGLKQGDVVGLNASNCKNLSSIIFACFTLGIAVNPLAITMDVNDICSIWSKTKPKIIFCDGKIVETVKSAVDKMELNVNIFTLIEKVEGFMEADKILEMKSENVEDFEYPDLPNIPSTIALILCSSGTTALPKLICKSHKQIITNFYIFTPPNLESQDITFNNISSHWISYSIILISCALYKSKIVITSDRLTLDMYMDIVDRHKATVVPCPPPFGVVLLQSKNLRALKSVKYVIIGGSKFSEKLLHDLMPVFPNAHFQICYASSENDVISTFTFSIPKGISSGIPVKNAKLKIINEAGTALGPNETGEILCQTPAPFSGYFGDPEGSKLAFDSFGYVKTGDVGYIDDEGHVFVLYRISNVLRTMNSKGQYSTFKTLQLEEIIDEIDGVIQSCVVGVIDEKLFYDIIYAFVIKDVSKVDLTEEFVMNYVEGKVSDGKQITGGVLFVDKIPLTASGKVLYRELRKIAADENRKKNLEKKL